MLQHLPTERVIRRYVAELVRVLWPDGLLIFQLPSHMPLPYRLQLGRKAYLFLARLGLRRSWLYTRLGLQPMRMRFVPESVMAAHLRAVGARVLETRAEREDWGRDLAERLRLVPSSGILSTTYFRHARHRRSTTQPRPSPLRTRAA